MPFPQEGLHYAHELQFFFFYSPTSFLIFLLCIPFLFQQKHEEEEAILTGPPAARCAFHTGKLLLAPLSFAAAPIPLLCTYSRSCLLLWFGGERSIDFPSPQTRGGKGERPSSSIRPSLCSEATTANLGFLSEMEAPQPSSSSRLPRFTVQRPTVRP